MTAIKFEHQITTYPASRFQELVYFCTADGQCVEGSAPIDAGRTLTTLLDEQGDTGWELVNVAASPSGIVAFWRRPKAQ